MRLRNGGRRGGAGGREGDAVIRGRSSHDRGTVSSAALPSRRPPTPLPSRVSPTLSTPLPFFSYSFFFPMIVRDLRYCYPFPLHSLQNPFEVLKGFHSPAPPPRPAHSRTISAPSILNIELKDIKLLLALFSLIPHYPTENSSHPPQLFDTISLQASPTCDAQRRIACPILRPCPPFPARAPRPHCMPGL